MFAGKPIIGIVGGIGSGKSFIAKLFGEQGCLVTDSDQMSRDAFGDASVKHTLRQWWGNLVFEPSGEVDRSAVARKVFTIPSERHRLERLIHPIVNHMRQRLMQQHADNPAIRAFVWDTPLLVETGLHEQCDAIVFVDAPLSIRQQRVCETRGWSGGELEKRENSQTPLDKKREIADYVLVNTADAENARAQVRDVLSRILADCSSNA